MGQLCPACLARTLDVLDLRAPGTRRDIQRSPASPGGRHANNYGPGARAAGKPARSAAEPPANRCARPAFAPIPPSGTTAQAAGRPAGSTRAAAAAGASTGGSVTCYTASQASGLPGRSDKPRLVRSAPNTWNISPTYDRGRVSIRVGLSYNQANIFQYQYQDGTPTLDGTPSTPTPGGIKGPDSDVYLYSHLEIDAQGSIRLAHGLTFVAYGLNLNNEVFGFYQGSSRYDHPARIL